MIDRTALASTIESIIRRATDTAAARGVHYDCSVLREFCYQLKIPGLLTDFEVALYLLQTAGVGNVVNNRLAGVSGAISRNNPELRAEIDAYREAHPEQFSPERQMWENVRNQRQGKTKKRPKGRKEGKDAAVSEGADHDELH